MKNSRRVKKYQSPYVLDDIKVFPKSKKNNMEALIQTIKMYSMDISIEFVNAKCAMLIMKSGKREKT